ncbi:MAG: metal ABC transporter permease [Thiobacillus sp. 63-78]|uniref:ABCB family ABC transporter ATP-binding protein/permease n=1 Tax=Thiobacillus sp. 63-78 TaxID=1895859 RepID=UPI00086BAB84|nr:ABC transporter ATP-binding protein/permease [Thiobacillus sp. 63-78]MBN8764026.1 ABC transporter ATP-binding protein/permease [Thiobacillus sp.]MBN8774761.1 ABC transporter ATP-binding protein/permease [Thiobacillus sp.]ODV09614.1 MAG: metal ABC transporter permease [Thiobacillus sp. SCN 64-317]OJZ16687.1 MAG: metal ABC transporter permease [Thiobacillus sp. 63-78]
MHPNVHSHTAPPPPGDPSLRSIGRLFPYLWEFRGRVLLALTLLVGAKLASVAVPLVLKEIIDALDQPRAELVLPLALILGYGLLRFASTTFSDLRDVIFAKVTQRAVRRINMAVLQHLHALSLRFHLERQTGGITRDIERGARAVSSLVGFLLFRIAPTILEILLVAGIMFAKLDWVFGVITLITLAAYIGFTVTITEWRTQFVRRANTLDSEAYGRAIDSLLNYETVKYFGNEKYEAERYDSSLVEWERMALKSQRSLGMLNAAQALVIAVGITLMVLRAADGVVHGTLTLGDLVMVNAFLLQMFQPLNFLGVMYRQIKESITDVERMFALLKRPREVADADNARALEVSVGTVKFTHVCFAYNPDRPILNDVDFTIPAGKTVAVVGSSGAGKSTLARLLFRFYDVGAGSIDIDGQDIRQVTQDSLRAAIGVVPQDTVLFNDTIYYNIAYGRPGASREEVIEAARAAHILGFIESLPKGWDTVVGERGLKLSGGEKQRVAIARTLLKNPVILILDEATSALDTRTEKAIQAELQEIARDRTTLIIAHRLSTVDEADEILVMEGGRIVERGRHPELLLKNGVYAHMWALQQQAEEEAV